MYLRPRCIFYTSRHMNHAQVKNRTSSKIYLFLCGNSDPIISNVTLGKQHTPIIWNTYGFIMFKNVYKQYSYD